MKLRSLLLIALVAVVFCGCHSYQPTSITVASYNLRNANGSDSAKGNGWGQRYPVIAKMVQYHDFDIFGTQECFIHQLKDMKEALPGYDYIGVGRDDGKEKGEHSAIFYRTDKFDVIENITSRHWKFASEKKCVEFREWLEEVHGEVFEIGAGEFKESGTTVSTMAVVIKK